MQHTNDQWWLAAAGDAMIWARLRVLDSGSAEVFDAAGETLRYDDEDAARAALMDAEFRAFDGIDEEDAALHGFDLDSVEPPQGKTDEEVLPQMTQKLLLGDN